MGEDLEDQVWRFETQVNSVLAGVQACLKELIEEKDQAAKYLLAERIAVLGSVMLPTLRSALAGPRVEGDDTRYLVAWIAIAVGDRDEAVEVLCDEIARGTKWEVPAAVVLGRYRIGRSRHVILSAFERVDPRDGIAVSNLSEALREVGGELPDALRKRILDEADPWIAQAVASDFPRESFGQDGLP